MSKLAERFFIYLPKATTCVSKPLCDYYLAKYRREVLYIPNGITFRPVPDPSLIAKWSVGRRGYLFCSAGRVERTKGLTTLFKAYGIAQPALPLVIAGGGSATDSAYLEELRASAPEGVIFTGFLTGEEYYALYAHARIFIFPSEYEAMSMALLEGLSFGAPTIYSDIPENEAVARGLGYSFHVSNAESLAAQIAYVLAHPAEAESLGRRASETVRANHDWSRIARQYDEVYRRVAGNKT
jgi:glycosyltransferase involved in cell wall biosynthesis